MSDSLTIINRSLGKVNAPPISSLTDGSSYAEVINREWVPARNSVLRAHPWPCCITRAKLNRSEEAPAWEFNYAHVLPVDYAVLVEVFPETKYSIESGLLLTDAEEVSIKYVSTETKNFDAALTDAVVYELAARIAMPLTSKRTLAEQLEMKADKALSRAIHTCSREATPKAFRERKWKAIKNGRYHARS